MISGTHELEEALHLIHRAWGCGYSRMSLMTLTSGEFRVSLVHDYRGVRGGIEYLSNRVGREEAFRWDCWDWR